MHKVLVLSLLVLSALPLTAGTAKFSGHASKSHEAEGATFSIQVHGRCFGNTNALDEGVNDVITNLLKKAEAVLGEPGTPECLGSVTSSVGAARVHSEYYDNDATKAKCANTFMQDGRLDINFHGDMTKFATFYNMMRTEVLEGSGKMNRDEKTLQTVYATPGSLSGYLTDETAAVMQEEVRAGAMKSSHKKFDQFAKDCYFKDVSVETFSDSSSYSSSPEKLIGLPEYADGAPGSGRSAEPVKVRLAPISVSSSLHVTYSFEGGQCVFGEEAKSVETKKNKDEL